VIRTEAATIKAKMIAETRKALITSYSMINRIKRLEPGKDFLARRGLDRIENLPAIERVMNPDPTSGTVLNNAPAANANFMLDKVITRYDMDRPRWTGGAAGDDPPITVQQSLPLTARLREYSTIAFASSATGSLRTHSPFPCRSSVKRQNSGTSEIRSVSMCRAMIIEP
jgi:hypothetical protein